MAFDRDSNLTPDARSYVQSLHDSAARDTAREYAQMDDQAFRARIGPGLDEVDRKLDALLSRPSVAIVSPNSLSKRQAAGLSLFGGAVVEGLINAAQRFHLFGWHS